MSAATGIDTAPAEDVQAVIDAALFRSALYEALALGFRPPSGATLARLTGRGAAAALVFAAERLDPFELGPAMRRLVASHGSTAALAEEHRHLFGHTARGAVPAYDTEYGSDDLFRQPQEMADIAGFYAAFGLGMAAAVGERLDHVSCECEFLMFLARKEAHALERGDAAMLAETRKAGRLFLRDHLGRFLPTLAENLQRAAGAGFHGALAALADAYVRYECARVGVTPGPPTLALRRLLDDGVPMACGTCPLGPQDGPLDGD